MDDGEKVKITVFHIQKFVLNRYMQKDQESSIFYFKNQGCTKCWASIDTCRIAKEMGQVSKSGTWERETGIGLIWGWSRQAEVSVGSSYAVDSPGTSLSGQKTVVYTSVQSTLLKIPIGLRQTTKFNFI